MNELTCCLFFFYFVRVLTRAFVRNYSKCMVRLNTQTEFAVIENERSKGYFYSVSKQKKSVKRRRKNDEEKRMKMILLLHSTTFVLFIYEYTRIEAADDRGGVRREI